MDEKWIKITDDPKTWPKVGKFAYFKRVSFFGLISSEVVFDFAEWVGSRYEMHLGLGGHFDEHETIPTHYKYVDRATFDLLSFYYNKFKEKNGKVESV